MPFSFSHSEPIEDLPFDMDMMGDFMTDNMDFNWVNQATMHSAYKTLTMSHRVFGTVISRVVLQ
jgi:hypothetical protein